MYKRNAFKNINEMKLLLGLVHIENQAKTHGVGQWVTVNTGTGRQEV